VERGTELINVSCKVSVGKRAPPCIAARQRLKLY
jgi:hypothetical protein